MSMVGKSLVKKSLNAKIIYNEGCLVATFDYPGVHYINHRIGNFPIGLTLRKGVKKTRPFLFPKRTPKTEKKVAP